MFMNATRVTILAGVVLAATVGASPCFAARAHHHYQRTSSFDGSWSVSVVTDKGTCDRGYRYRIRISGGVVSYDDSNGIQISVSGRVSARGSLRVTVGRGDQSATGVGRLTGTTGTGRWSGRSSSQKCSGHWEAERRD